MSQPPTSLPVEIAEYKLDQSIGYLFMRVRSAMNNAVCQQTVAELGITNTQASILFMLATGKAMAAVDLARDYGIDASAVTRLIDRLEKRGLLLRERSLEDRRVVKLQLTAEGYAIAARMPAIFTGLLDQMLQGFAPVEVDTLRTMLKRILCNTGELVYPATVLGAASKHPAGKHESGPA
jgi:DNA-binding MarR family transcriptional regulator